LQCALRTMLRLVVDRSLNPCFSAFDLGLPRGRRDATPNLSSCGLQFTVHATTTFLYSIRLMHRPGLARSTICISICRTPSISNFGSFSQPNVISYNQLNPLQVANKRVYSHSTADASKVYCAVSSKVDVYVWTVELLRLFLYPHGLLIN
jgi:hypothetical protein